MKRTENEAAEPGGEPPSTAAGGTGKRWPRRRLLRWALGLLPLAAGGGWAALQKRGPLNRRVAHDRWESEGPVDGWRGETELEPAGPPEGAPDARTRAEQWTRDAAVLCFARHEGTSSRLVFALRADDSYAPARLVFACWFIEQDQWDVARKELLHPSLKNTPESRLLLELMERRPQSADWRHAFFEAWKALGRPDFSQSTLLPEPLEDGAILPYVYQTLEQLDEPRRLPLVTVFTKEEESHPEWGLDQVRASVSVPLLMALRERLLLLPAETPPRSRLLPAVEERLGQLTGPAPQTLQLALRSFLAARPSEAPFQRRDLEALEPLVSLEWKQPASEHFFREMHERFDGLLLLPGHHAWLMASWAQGVSLGRELNLRAQASAAHLGEEERRWMGRLLWEVGKRLREQRSRLELETGLRLQAYGSELTQHMPTRMESIDFWMELGNWEQALKRSGWQRWPLGSLHEECCEPRVRDEHLWLKAFAGKAELP